MGSGAGSAYTGTESSNILIGANGTAGESSVIRIGGSQTTAYIAGISGVTSSGGVAVYINSSGQLGTVVSSRRFKEDIHDLGNESRVLMSLRPVSFKYKPMYDASGEQQYGLIAEEVAEVAPQLVVYDAEGQPQTVKYHLVDAMLLNEFQRHEREIVEQRSLLDATQGRVQQQETIIASLVSRLDQVDAERAAQQRTIDAQQQQISDLQARETRREREIAALTERLTRLEAQEK